MLQQSSLIFKTKKKHLQKKKNKPTIKDCPNVENIDFIIFRQLSIVENY